MATIEIKDGKSSVKLAFKERNLIDKTTKLLAELSHEASPLKSEAEEARNALSLLRRRISEKESPSEDATQGR